MELAFCSSCNHSESYGERGTRQLTGAKYKTIPKPEYCSQCGSKMLYGCQKCGSPRERMEDKFCKKCGTAYKSK